MNEKGKVSSIWSQALGLWLGKRKVRVGNECGLMPQCLARR